MLEYAWAPQPGPQADAITATWCDELFFGGARGGGKSDYLLGDYLQDVERYERHWQGILFRKTYPELSGILERAYALYPQTGAEWKEGKHEWHWPNGAKLRLRHLEQERDAGRYQGHQYPWIGFDELGNWSSPNAYNMIKACRRWGDTDVPTKRVRATGNPGGAGHQWIKARFIDPAPTGFSPIQDPDTKWWRMFVPSKVTDNLVLLANDPGYIDSLKGVGSPELVRAWLSGDWSAICGSYYPEFSVLTHVVEPFDLSKYPHWTRFRSFDWGSARPFCCLWHCVVSESTEVGGRLIPAGCIIVYRELYGASQPNVGLKLTAKEVAERIKNAERHDPRIAYGVADPAIFTADGGPSIAEEMRKEGVIFRPADNSRIAGWTQIRQRLKGEDEKPMAIMFSTCTNTIRTLPALQHDSSKPEDLDTDGEDHAADALRYGLMSRPYTQPAPKKQEPIRGIERATLNEMWKLTSRGSKRL